MARSVGNINKKKAMSFGQLTEGFAEQLVTRDERFENFLNYKPSRVQKEFFASPKRIKVAVGSNRSRKTSTGIIEDIMIYTGMVPYALRGVYAHEHEIPKRARHVRIICQNYSKHFPETIQKFLVGDPKSGTKGYLPVAWSKYNEDQHIYYGPDGSMLSVMAIDPNEDVDPNILRGADVDHTHVDESCREEIWGESLVRAAASMKQEEKLGTISWTYCPQMGLESWEYKAIYLTAYDLRTDELKPEKEQSRDIYCRRWAMSDNPSITPEEIEYLRRTLRKWEIPFRVDGRYTSRTNDLFFDVNTLEKWRKEGRCDAGAKMKFEFIETNFDAGKFKGSLVPYVGAEDEERFPVWEMWEAPKEGERYILTVDSAEGNPDSSWHSASVWKGTARDRLKQVAHLHIQLLKPRELAIQCGCMGTFFGKCLIVPETNNTCGGIIIEILRMYSNIYTRASLGKKDEEDTEKLGWHTGAVTKPMMLEDMYQALRRMASETPDWCPFNCEHTLSELMTFEEKITRDEAKGTTKVFWAARRGTLGDCVMEAAIAFRVVSHEYFKLSVCRLERNVRQSPKLSKMEEEASVKGSRAKHLVQNMPKVPNILEQRQRNTIGADPYARFKRGIHA